MGKWWSSSASSRRISRVAVAVALALVATGCGRDRGPAAGNAIPAATDDATPSGTLPAPAAAPGTSITGMPTQPPPPQPVDETPAAPVVDEAAPADPAAGTPPVDPVPSDATDPSAAAQPAVPGPPASVAPPPADLAAATGLVTQYMAAVSSGAIVRAQGLWSTTPNDSGVLQLARGPAFDVSVGTAVADATGRISVPVDVRGTAEDGSARHSQVAYAVQRTPTGTWRILSATVRDVTP